MGYRAAGSLLCLLGALAACAKGGLPDNGGSALTFGSGASATQAMTTDPSSDSATNDTDDETDTDESTGVGSTVGSASNSDSDPSETMGSEVGGELCGNGMIDGVEDCDGADLGGTDCIGAGLVGGALACSAQCTFDTSGCVSAICADGTLQEGETCDCGAMGSPCTPAQLGNQSCTGLPAPTGGNYSGGSLACTPQCTFNESGCTSCGNGAIDAGETCDGAALGGQTCQSQGFDAGSLSCSACALNTGACVDYVCGNGACDPNEDSCTCPQDCPDDPNSCSDCQCGASGGACYCDLACIDFGDCCFDGPC